MILYIKILSVSKKGFVCDYTIKEVFTDMQEMFKWFAYSAKTLPEREVSDRYDVYIWEQNLTGSDTVTECVAYDERGPVFVRRLRSYMLYDTSTESVIDLRKYVEDIKKNKPFAIRQTKYCKSKKRNKRTGRRHKKGFEFRRTSMYRGTVSRYAESNKVDGTNIQLKPYRGNKNSDWEFVAVVENNWKQRKVRKQWQWHIKGASKFKPRSKYCDSSWERLYEA